MTTARFHRRSLGLPSRSYLHVSRAQEQRRPAVLPRQRPRQAADLPSMRFSRQQGDRLQRCRAPEPVSLANQVA